MKIKDAHARVNGNDEVIDIPCDSINILADDGQTMFSVSLRGSTLQIEAGHVCQHGELLLDDRYVIEPRASNLIYIHKCVYKADKP